MSLSDLHDAIKDGDMDTFIRLCQRGVDINEVYIRETAFTQALEAGHDSMACRIMKSPSFQVDAVNKFERTALFSAAKDGKYDMALTLLEMGADIEACDIRGVTPLGATAWYDSHKVAQLLIDRGANINQQDNSGETPLFRACSNVSTNVVEILLKNGADVNLATYENDSCPQHTPLMAALPSKYQLEVRKRKMTEMIFITKLMLSYGCDINRTQRDGRTALHLAVDRNELYGACLLIDHGCDLEVRDKEGLTALQLAVQPDSPQYEMALYLILYGADVNSRFTENVTCNEVLPLTMVMKTRPESALVQEHRKRLLYALIPATDLTGRSIFEVIETMLEDLPVPEDDFNLLQEINVNQPASLQSHCRYNIRKSLGQNILKKIDVLPVGWQVMKYISLDFDYRGFPPLRTCAFHIAVLDNEHGLLETLLGEGCDVNTPLGYKTPLTLAAQSGNVEAVNVLLKHGSDPSLLNKEGQSALHTAASLGLDNVLRVLLTTKCDVNALNTSGCTPLEEAAKIGHFETVILLLNHGGNSLLMGPSGIPIIHLAAGSGHLPAVRLLLLASGGQYFADRFGNTPLHVAASRGMIYLKNNIRLPALYKAEVLEMMDAVKMPLTNGMPQHVRSDGVDHLKVLELLLQNTTNRSARNNNDQTAVDLARQYFNEAVSLF